MRSLTCMSSSAHVCRPAGAGPLEAVAEAAVAAALLLEHATQAVSILLRPGVLNPLVDAALDEQPALARMLHWLHKLEQDFLWCRSLLEQQNAPWREAGLCLRKRHCICGLWMQACMCITLLMAAHLLLLSSLVVSCLFPEPMQ